MSDPKVPGVGRVDAPAEVVEVGRVTHYYDEDYPTDHELAPLCKRGVLGDEMTFFVEETTCPRCKEAFHA